MDIAHECTVISRRELEGLQRDIAAARRIGFLAGIALTLALVAIVQSLARLP